MHINTDTCRSFLFGVLSSAVLVSSGSAFADDIDVYGVAGVGLGAQLPNVLFVFDTSSSMLRQIDGSEVTSSSQQSKLDILRDSVEQMVDQNGGVINVGVLSFNKGTGGVKWPISNLQSLASAFDGDIPADKTVSDVITSIVRNEGTGSATSSVDGLFEAARYFRGDSVWLSGTGSDSNHKPNTWDTGSDRYTGGGSKAANPIAYTPPDAYSETSVNVAGTTKSCKDYSLGGAVTSATNYCSSYSIQYCDADTASTLEYDPDRCVSSSSTCDEYDVTGTECLHSTSSCTAWGGMVGSNAYRRCYYQGADSVSIVKDWAGANYISPIGQSCQSNFIVFLSDGAPSRNAAKSSVESLIGGDCQPLSSSIFGVGDGSYDYGDCGPELLEYLNTNDQVASIPDSKVTTYTIGFGLGGTGASQAQNYLGALATAGGGDFLQANQADQLSQAFSTIINQIAGDGQTNSGLVVDVDRQGMSHDNQAYLSLFMPGRRRAWKGNLKGYYIDDDGIKDVNDQLATEATVDGTQFKNSAQSFWSASSDGNEVGVGGANEQLVAGSRNLYTNTNSADPNNLPLAAAENGLHSSNGDITAAMLGAAIDATQRVDILDWIQTQPMGDPLHTQPKMVQYVNKKVVYSMTNQGFLHAVDASSPSLPGDTSGGQEIFAFIPRRLLENLADLKTNAFTGPHIYGMDGGLTLWHKDINGNAIVDGSDRVYLFAGMRRGGDAYYALDVTNPNTPQLKWRIDPTTSGFSELGQTWSRMSLVSIKWNGSPRTVLVFGGGYDSAIDSETSRDSHDLGHTIYMIDPEDGQLLWSVGEDSPFHDEEDMEYSIPADIRVIDSDGNGFADRLYAGDMGGQVWRIDMDESSFNGSAGTTVTRIATLADGSDAGHRQFFYPPTVVKLGRGHAGTFGIGIGSGNRSNPLEGIVENRVYLLKDTSADVGSPSSPYLDDVDHGDLYDATANPIETATDIPAERALLSSKQGWYISLGVGEKSLSTLSAIEGQLLFTTYAPDNSSTSASLCGFSGATRKVYFIDQKDATTPENAANLSISIDRSKTLPGMGIPSAPVIVFPQGGSGPDIYVDKERVGTLEQSIRSVYWFSD